MNQDRLNHWAGQVMRYIEYVWPRLERTGGIADLPPMDRKAKGKSTPPVGDTALRIMGKNGGREWDEDTGQPLTSETSREVFAMMRGELDRLEAGRNSMKSEDGIGFTEVVRAVREDAGVITTWKAAENATEAHRRLRALEDACEYVARVLLYHDPRNEDGSPYHLHVHVSPEDLAARSPKQAAARDREASRKQSHARSHYKRYEDFRAIERENPTASRQALMVMWSERYDMSPSTIRDSIRFCEKHLWPSAASKHGGWQAGGSLVEEEYRYNGGDDSNGEAA